MSKVNQNKMAAVAAQLLTLDRKEEVYLILNFLSAYGTEEGETLLNRIIERMILPEEVFED